jgi:two-component system response regulator VicR
MAKVLIVEDELGVAEVLSMMLEIEGFEVLRAINGKDALAQLERTPPALIITDFMMPLMDGGELAKHVRTSPQLAQIPILMTSATEARQVQKYASYFDAFLRKPYLWEDLFTVIRTLLPPPA